ncbi:MAG: hypothetical protein MPK62_02270 [Alphaproteobacteria bacterium]|nr:hypothetical protein [Alphaproteobacteria bacterium]MDA8029960.1 hypothetical protein [Alphaproteobacteria bacterium]
MRTTILSMGAGVNSVACLLKYWNLYKHVIFADTMVEKAGTYWYIRNFLKPFCESKGINWITVRNRWNEPLHEHYARLHTMPNQKFRMCTREFKIEPIMKKVEELGATPESPFHEHIGIAYDERKRAKFTKHEVDWLVKEFPMVRDNITRQDCVDIIKGHGWPVPIKSGCEGCFYASRKDLVLFARNRPKEFLKWVHLEETAKNYPKYKWHRSGKPLRPLMHVGNLDAFMEEQPESCDEGYCMEFGAEPDTHDEDLRQEVLLARQVQS